MTAIKPLSGLTTLALATALCTSLATAAFAQATPDNFIVAVAEEPDTLDLTSTGHAPGARVTLENITEGLWRTAPDGTIEAGLAEIETSADGREITFRLREGVVFHSGDPLTADDVVFSHERMNERAAQYARRAMNIASVEALDPLTVKVTFSTPDAGFLPARGFAVVSKAYFDRVGEEEFVRHPVGTGPYEFVKYTPGTSLELKRFADYWGDAPEVENVTFRFVREGATRVSQLMAGEVGMILDMPYPDVPRVTEAGFGIDLLPAHPTVAIQFHNQNPDVPWADPRVREAMAYAVDREAIARDLLQGVPDVTEAVAEGELGYDPDIAFRAYDPARAKELLAEAGYPDGVDIPLYVWGGGMAGLRETAEAVAIYLGQAGFNLSVETLEPSKFLETVRNVSGDPAAEFIGLSALPWANQSDPTEALAVAFHSRVPFSPFRSAEVDALIDAARAEVNPENRDPLIRDAYRQLYDDVAIVPLWNFQAVYATAPGVDFTPTAQFFPIVTLRHVTFE